MPERRVQFTLLSVGVLVAAVLVFALGGGATSTNLDGDAAGSVAVAVEVDGAPPTSAVPDDKPATVAADAATADVEDEGDVDGSFGGGEGGVDAEFDSTEGEVDDSFRYSDLPAITIDQLPLEALDTLDLIERGGPYPYAQDDGAFGNREGLLPSRPTGHYQEYTVETPGSDDRGARRIVRGADGERYWTADHYASFFEIVF